MTEAELYNMIRREVGKKNLHPSAAAGRLADRWLDEARAVAGGTTLFHVCAMALKPRTGGQGDGTSFLARALADFERRFGTPEGMAGTADTPLYISDEDRPDTEQPFQPPERKKMDWWHFTMAMNNRGIRKAVGALTADDCRALAAYASGMRHSWGEKARHWKSIADTIGERLLFEACDDLYTEDKEFLAKTLGITVERLNGGSVLAA